MNSNKQIEMTLEAPRMGKSTAPRLARQQKAKWWFNQMRMVVDSAFDWNSAPPAHPEQMSMALGRRH